MFAFDRGDVFFSYILPHGLMELTAIFIAAAAGLRIFWSWVSPGPHTRLDSLAREGRSLITVAVGLVLVLFVSGLVEGFVTPSPLPVWAKISIGALVLAGYWAYTLILGGRAVRGGGVRRSGRGRRRSLRPLGLRPPLRGSTRHGLPEMMPRAKSTARVQYGVMELQGGSWQTACRCPASHGSRNAPTWPPHPWRRFVAMGDSFTEGLDDPEPGSSGGYRGWADRVAEELSVGVPDFAYANLAVRGQQLHEVLETQLGQALRLGPDLVSLQAGGNDLLHPGADPDKLAGHAGNRR